METFKNLFSHIGHTGGLKADKFETVHPGMHAQQETEATPDELKSVALAGIVLALLFVAGFSIFSLLLITLIF